MREMVCHDVGVCTFRTKQPLKQFTVHIRSWICTSMWHMARNFVVYLVLEVCTLFVRGPFSELGFRLEGLAIFRCRVYRDRRSIQSTCLWTRCVGVEAIRLVTLEVQAGLGF